MVPDAQNNTKRHVYHAEDDGDLHFVRVQIRDLVLGQLPNGIHAEWVRRLAVVAGHLVGDEHLVRFIRNLMVSQVRLVRRAEDVERLREHVVVDHASVDGEETHEEHDVPTSKADDPDLIKTVVSSMRFCVLRTGIPRSESFSQQEASLSAPSKKRTQPLKHRVRHRRT